MSRQKETLDLIIRQFTSEDRLLAQLLYPPRFLQWCVGVLFAFDRDAKSAEEYKNLPCVNRTAVDFGCVLDTWAIRIAERRYAERKLKRIKLKNHA